MNNHVHLHTDGTAVPLAFEDMTYATTSIVDWIIIIIMFPAIRQVFIMLIPLIRH